MQKIRVVNSEDISLYLKDLRKIPLITHQRETEIFKMLSNNNISDEDKLKLKHELLQGNLRFVISIAKGYQNQGIELIDLISEGNIGLFKSIDKFNLSNGVKFISYAVWWIRQSIMVSLNDNLRTIRIPSNVIQEAQKIRKTQINQENSGDFTELKTYSTPYCVSLSKEIDNDGGELIDIIRDPNDDSPENNLKDIDDIKRKVKNMLRVLDHRSKIIIEKSFGLNGVETDLDDLGKEFNCTKERIRQLSKKALKKLRNESFPLLDNYR